MKLGVFLGGVVLLATLAMPLGALGQKTAQDFLKDGNVKMDEDDRVGAIADFSKAIELAPKSTVAYIFRGIANQSKGELAEAIADFSKAIELDPNEAVAYVNRGMAKKFQGDQVGADADFAQAAKLLPPRPPAADAEANQLFGVPEDELVVTVNGRELKGEEKKARLQAMGKLTKLTKLLELPQSDFQLKGAGIGAQIALTKEGLPFIVTPLPESPAAMAGLTQGDVIVAIDNEPTKGQDFMKIIQRLRGNTGTTVMLAISRSGLAVPFEVKITRMPIKVQKDSGTPMGYSSRDTETHEVVTIMRKGVNLTTDYLERIAAQTNGTIPLVRTQDQEWELPERILQMQLELTQKALDDLIVKAQIKDIQNKLSTLEQSNAAPGRVTMPAHISAREFESQYQLGHHQTLKDADYLGQSDGRAYLRLKSMSLINPHHWSERIVYVNLDELDKTFRDALPPTKYPNLGNAETAVRPPSAEQIATIFTYSSPLITKDLEGGDDGFGKRIWQRDYSSTNENFGRVSLTLLLTPV